MRMGALLVLLLAHRGRARAQEGDDARRREARAAFVAGERMHAQGQIESALENFRRAFELAPHDAVCFNIATCLGALRRIRDSVREFEIAAMSTQLDAATRARARNLADEMRGRLGTLVIEGNDEFQARVDGRETCALPCRMLVDPGSHAIVISTPNGPMDRTTEVSEGGVVTLRFERWLEAPADPGPPTTDPEARPPVVPVPESSPAQHGPTPRPPSTRGTSFPSWLGWTGLVVTTAGAAGAIGFGLRAQAIHDTCEPHCPTLAARDEGELMRTLANMSLSLAIAGAVGVILDLVLSAVDAPATERARASMRGAVWSW
jgi:hypothetical protein